MKSFTLLETILAISIIVMIMGTVCAFYHYSLNMVEAGRAHLEQSQLARVILDQIARELRCAPGLQSRFGSVLQGQRHRITFLTAAVPSRLVFFPTSIMDTPLPPEHDLRRTEYRLARDEEERVLGLKRSELRLLLTPLIEEKTDEELAETETGEGEQGLLAALNLSVDDLMTDVPLVDEQILSDRILYLEFEYYNGREWLTEWSADVLPRAVRIIIGFNEVGEDQERDEALLTWSDRPWHEDQYTLIVPLSLSEELKARQAEAAIPEGP